jgi:hypothetical protein
LEFGRKQVVEAKKRKPGERECKREKTGEKPGSLFLA